MYIRIDGNLLLVHEVFRGGYLPMIEADGLGFYLAESSEAAGKAAREYWEDMAQDDPAEFTCLVGEKTLIAWGLGQYAGPGYSQVQSLPEWLDLWLDEPEGQWASYDGVELGVDRVGHLVRELGFTPTVAYRCN